LLYLYYNKNLETMKTKETVKYKKWTIKKLSSFESWIDGPRMSKKQKRELYGSDEFKSLFPNNKLS
jgi:hypothetical protein